MKRQKTPNPNKGFGNSRQGLGGGEEDATPSPSAPAGDVAGGDGWWVKRQQISQPQRGHWEWMAEMMLKCGGGRKQCPSSSADGNAGGGGGCSGGRRGTRMMDEEATVTPNPKRGTENGKQVRLKGGGNAMLGLWWLQLGGNEEVADRTSKWVLGMKVMNKGGEGAAPQLVLLGGVAEAGAGRSLREHQRPQQGHWEWKA